MKIAPQGTTINGNVYFVVVNRESSSASGIREPKTGRVVRALHALRRLMGYITN